MNAPTNQFPDLPETFDLNELKDIFSAEEIAAMAEGDDPLVKLPDPETKTDADSVTAQDEAAMADAIAAAAEAAKQAQTQPAAEKQDQQVEEPPIELPDTRVAEEILQSYDSKLEEIQRKYDEGELSAAEMTAEVKKLTQDQIQAQRTVDEATRIITEANERNNQRWMASLETFKAAGNEVLWSPEHVKGFDASLKRVTNAQIHPEFAGKPFDFLIQTAARLYAAQHEAVTGKTLAIGAAKPKAQQTTTPAAEQKALPRTDPRPDAPQLLGGLNGDGGLSVDDGTFAAIDRAYEKDPFEGERMLASLSPQQRELYLRGA